MSNPLHRLRPLPAAPLVVHRQILDRGAQAVARGAARCASQVLDFGALAVALLCIVGT
jgi:hypothetical protein